MKRSHLKQKIIKLTRQERIKQDITENKAKHAVCEENTSTLGTKIMQKFLGKMKVKECQ